MFVTDFATAYRYYASSSPALTRVVHVRQPLKLFIMDRRNLDAVYMQVVAGKLPIKLWWAFQQVTGYGIVKEEYDRFGMQPSALFHAGVRKTDRRAYGILTEGALLPKEILYAAGRLATYVCQYFDCDGWVYPPQKYGTSTSSEYAARKRIDGGHFHDEVMLCRQGMAKVGIRELSTRELRQYVHGHPGQDPELEWIDDSNEFTTGRAAVRKTSTHKQRKHRPTRHSHGLRPRRIK